MTELTWRDKQAQMLRQIGCLHSKVQLAIKKATTERQTEAVEAAE